jgi:hypothetical protein
MLLVYVVHYHTSDGCLGHNAGGGEEKKLSGLHCLQTAGKQGHGAFEAMWVLDVHHHRIALVGRGWQRRFSQHQLALSE